jgi:MoxR-like ATPase
MTETHDNINVVTPRELAEAIRVSMRSKVPLMIWGAPGIGKSQIMAQVANEDDYMLRDVRATLIDPIDLRGIPHAVQHDDGSYRTHYAPPAFLPNGDDKPTLLLLDEIVTAPQSTQGALYQLILDRALGEYKAPDSTVMIAAGNREGDKAATHKMPTPLANRFCHLELITDHEQWVDWAFENDIDHRVIAFLNFRPGLLHDFDPRNKSKAFPSPRSWEKTSDTLKASPPDALLHPMVAGLIGDGAAHEFASESSALWAASIMVGSTADESNAEAIMQYASRLPDEYAVVCVRAMHLRNKELVHNKAFKVWAHDRRYLFVDK